MRQSMPTFPLKAARRTLLPAAVLMAMAIVGAPVLGQTTVPDELTITIHPVGKQPVEILLGEALEGGTFGGSTGATYKVRKNRKGTPRPVQIPASDRAASIEEILAKRGLQGGYRYLTVSSPSGNTVIMSRQRISTDDAPPAIYLDDNDQLRFIGSSSVGSQDINFTESFSVDGASLDLKQTNKSQLGTVVLHCDKESIEPGDRLNCTARAIGARGDRYKFEFDFDDGQPEVVVEDLYFNGDVKASHVYEKADDYKVTVTVTTNGDKANSNRTSELTVEAPRSQSQSATGGGGTYDPGEFYDDFNSYINPGTTTTTPPSTYDSNPSFDYDFGGDVPKTTTDDNTVEGNLLASLSTPGSSAPGSASASSGGSAQAATATFELPESDENVPPAAWAGLGALALFGAGAGLESGRLRLRRPRLSLRRR